MKVLLELVWMVINSRQNDMYQIIRDISDGEGGEERLLLFFKY
jgi:hypothetical protein